MLETLRSTLSRFAPKGVLAIAVLASIATSRAPWEATDQVELGEITIDAATPLEFTAQITPNSALKAAEETWLTIEILLEGENTAEGSGELQLFVDPESLSEEPAATSTVRGMVGGELSEVYTTIYAEVDAAGGVFEVTLSMEGDAAVVADATVIARMSTYSEVEDGADIKLEVD